MNRQAAIIFIQDKLVKWPRSLNLVAPTGWVWKMRSAPYERPTPVLQSIEKNAHGVYEYIERSDTKL